jgi:hypothetical protein
MVLSIVFLEDKYKMLLHLSIFFKITQVNISINAFNCDWTNSIECNQKVILLEEEKISNATSFIL